MKATGDRSSTAFTLITNADIIEMLKWGSARSANTTSPNTNVQNANYHSEMSIPVDLN